MRRLASLFVLAVVATGCGESPVSPPEPVGWQPGQMLPSVTDPTARGLLDVRGLIHAHSPYSHDACDGEPRDPVSGAIDEVCFDDMRRGVCQVKHDFVMLTDHKDSFASTGMVDALLHRDARGDVLVEHDGAPTANWAACPDGPPTLVLAGTESGLMPVGLERHVADTEEERNAVYGAASSNSVDAYRALGGITLAQHTEDWTPQELVDLGVDGFEMYNLHANTLVGAAGAVSLLSKINTPEQLPHPDLFLVPIVSEAASYLRTWASIASSGERMVTTMGTDCHRNTFPQLLDDGERVDSYRRMMAWFSNHLLVEDGPAGWDDRALKDALAAGRLYGAFELLGYPDGFDFHALEGGDAHEMGGEVALDAGVELIVARPHLRDLDPTVEPPRITARILRADGDAWVEVAAAEGDLAVGIDTPGAYRAEIRMQPRHLRRHLSSYGDLADGDFVWIYANVIQVR